jgi:hypothetical protein
MCASEKYVKNLESNLAVVSQRLFNIVPIFPKCKRKMRGGEKKITKKELPACRLATLGVILTKKQSLRKNECHLYIINQTPKVNPEKKDYETCRIVINFWPCTKTLVALQKASVKHGLLACSGPSK